MILMVLMALTFEDFIHGIQSYVAFQEPPISLAVEMCNMFRDVSVYFVKFGR